MDSRFTALTSSAAQSLRALLRPLSAPVALINIVTVLVLIVIPYRPAVSVIA